MLEQDGKKETSLEILAISEKGFAKMESSVIWTKMDCRSSIFLYKKNVWRIRVLCYLKKYDTGNDVKSIIV